VGAYAGKSSPERGGDASNPSLGVTEVSHLLDTAMLADSGVPSVSPRGLPPPRSGEDLDGAQARSGEDLITKDAIFAYC
jgi:hypothetical protein